MKRQLQVSANATDLIRDLQNSGYEAYIVGGAVRDLLLGRNPKDFDISTSATPEEVRKVFGRRSSRLIGKRFRLAHVYKGGELFEVSTFRRTPRHAGGNGEAAHENLILSDNVFGTAEEDAWRRDFTVNALFYDPIREEIFDYTGQGLTDIESRTVRAIGEPALRFEEDPVRLLRALKLVAQFDFALDAATENALFAKLPLFSHASQSRLSLELEKILQSSYGDRHLQVFHDYGLLHYFLPEINRRWNTPPVEYALDLLYERNCRVEDRRYRNSVSLAAATVALPLIEAELGREPGRLWEGSRKTAEIIRSVLNRTFAPQTLMMRMVLSAERILLLQSSFESEAAPPHPHQHGYAHARELFLIRHAVAGDNVDELERRWPPASDRPARRRGGRRPGRK